MQVEITKMVYQHPWYLSLALHTSFGRLRVVFISPTKKVAIGDEILLFCYWPDAQVVLIGHVRSSRSLEPQSTDRTLPASGHLPPDASGHNFAALEPFYTRSNVVVLHPIDLAVQRPVAASAKPLDRSIRSLCYQCPVTSVSLFLRDLASGLVPIFVLRLCLISCVFSCASKILLMELIIGSSHRLRPSHVLHPIVLQKQSLANSLVQFGCVGHQTPKSKINGPRVYFPYIRHQNKSWWLTLMKSFSWG
jgi:hypothetical protein